MTEETLHKIAWKPQSGFAWPPRKATQKHSIGSAGCIMMGEAVSPKIGQKQPSGIVKQPHREMPMLNMLLEFTSVILLMTQRRSSGFVKLLNKVTLAPY